MTRQATTTVPRPTLLVVLCLATLVSSLDVAPSRSTSSSIRRQFLQRAIFTYSTASSGWLSRTPPSQAVQGAAEYDLEFYLRDLFGGNAKEGTIRPSNPPPLPPPRTLRGPLLKLLLNDDASAACIPTQILMQLNPKYTEQDIQKMVSEIRDKASRSFQTRAKWKEANVSDQYYFDLTSYALWRTAANVIPDNVKRNEFEVNIGRAILEEMLKEKLVTLSDTRIHILTGTVPAITRILELYKESNYCKGFRIGGDEVKDSSSIFDALDDEDLESGASLNLLVSVYEPATLSASLQITGEQSRFVPEFVGSTLAALFEKAGIQASYETYFVDPEYRPNPKDYFPNEQLLQFTLTKK